MKITAEGQVTIPRELRERAGLEPGCEVDLVLEGATVRIVKAPPERQGKSRGEMLVERLRGAGDFKMTTDEVLALMRGPSADEEERRRE